MLQTNSENLSADMGAEVYECLNLNQNSSLKAFCDEAQREVSGKIFLYGAGIMLHDALPCMEQCGLEIQGILDGNPQKTGTYFQGIPILSLDDVVGQLGDTAVAITTEKYASEISRILSRYLPANRIFRTSMYPLGAIRGKDIIYLYQYLKQNIDKMSEVYALLADETSRITFNIVIDSWLRFQGDRLSECITLPQYFTPQIVNNAEDMSCFIDVGAYIGDTIEDALSYLPQLKNIYAFEADKNNYESLIEKYENNSRVKIYQAALSDHQGSIAFSSGYNPESGMTGHCIEETSTAKKFQMVPAMCLDQFTETLGTPVSFIKIDVEGGEMDVLRGAVQTIRRDCPKLAVCVYHRNQDILEIPLWLHSIVPEYKFFLRQHSVQGTDTVLYAVKQ